MRSNDYHQNFFNSHLSFNVLFHRRDFCRGLLSGQLLNSHASDQDRVDVCVEMMAFIKAVLRRKILIATATMALLGVNVAARDGD